MQITDSINSGFQFVAVFFMCLNIRRLLRDKMLRGMSPVTIVFYTAWTYWGVFYYIALNQPWSLATSIAMSAVYTFWLYLVWKYKNK